MTEKITWITFHAHPTQLVEEEDFHPDFFGVFVVPVSRSEPQSLLKEVLGNRKLSLIDISNTQLKSKADDWGINERLKGQIDDHGFGINLVKMQPKPAEMD
jgi:hypothetical protein